MRIEGFIWYRDIVDKLLWKHNITHIEAEEVFQNKPLFKLIEKGKVKNENVYAARGRTHAGRYVSVFFIYKKTKEILIITARDMDMKERRDYGER